MDSNYEQVLSFFAGLGATSALHAHLDYATDTLICSLFGISGVNRHFITGNMTSIQRQDMLQAALNENFVMEHELQPKVLEIHKEYSRIRQLRNEYLHSLWYPNFQKESHQYYYFNARGGLKMRDKEATLIELFTLVEDILSLIARIKALFDSSVHLPSWENAHVEPGVAVLQISRLREFFQHTPTNS